MLKVNSSIKVTDPHSTSQVRRKTEEGKEKLLEVGNQSRSIESQHCQLVTVSFCGGSEDKAKPWIPSLCWITVSNINPPGFYEFSNPPHTTEKLSKSVSRHCELQERKTKPQSSTTTTTISSSSNNSAEQHKLFPLPVLALLSGRRDWNFHNQYTGALSKRAACRQTGAELQWQSTAQL